MAIYNQLGSVTYNRLGDIQYNDFRRMFPEAFDHRLPGARPVVFNQNMEPVAVLENAYDIFITEEKNGTDVLDFLLPFEDRKAHYLQNENGVLLAEKTYVIRTIDKSKDENGKKVVAVYAEAAWYDLQYADPMPSSTWTDETANTPMRDILFGTAWNVGVVDITAKRNLTVDSDLTNRLKALKQIPDVWGGSLVFDTKNFTVDLVDGSLADPGIAIVYNKNMKSIKAEYDTRDLITRLYPYGKNGLTIGDANDYVPYVENYQYTQQVRVRSFKDARFTNPYHLKEKAKAILSQLSVPRSSYQIKAADLSSISGLEHEAFKLGYQVNVYDKELDVDVKTEIVKWKYNVLEPWKTEIELSSTQPGLEDLLKTVTESASHLQSEDTVVQKDMLNLMVYNYLLNSRADNGDAYWVNNGWTIDAQNGYSGSGSFQCEGQYDVEKTLSQTVYPAHRDEYTISFRANTTQISKGPNGRVGVEVVVSYDDGSTSTEFLPLA